MVRGASHSAASHTWIAATFLVRDADDVSAKYTGSVVLTAATILTRRRLYSSRKATIGDTRDARSAGTTTATSALTSSTDKAAAIDSGSAAPMP